MIEDSQIHFFLFVNSKSGGGLGQEYLTLANKSLKFKSKNGIQSLLYIYDMCHT